MSYTGPIRVMVAPAHTTADDIRYIIDNEYDSVEPWIDYGAGKSGYFIEDDDPAVMRLQMADGPCSVPGPTFALAVLWQAESKVIHGSVWSEASYYPNEPLGFEPVKPLYFGECRTMPISFFLASEGVGV